MISLGVRATNRCFVFRMKGFARFVAEAAAN